MTLEPLLAIFVCGYPPDYGHPSLVACSDGTVLVAVAWIDGRPGDCDLTDYVQVRATPQLDRLVAEYLQPDSPVPPWGVWISSHSQDVYFGTPEPSPSRRSIRMAQAVLASVGLLDEPALGLAPELVSPAPAVPQPWTPPHYEVRLEEAGRMWTWVRSMRWPRSFPVPQECAPEGSGYLCAQLSPAQRAEERKLRDDRDGMVVTRIDGVRYLVRIYAALP